MTKFSGVLERLPGVPQRPRVAQRLAVFPEELLQVAPQHQRAAFLAEKLGVVLPAAAQRAEEPGAGQQAAALLVEAQQGVFLVEPRPAAALAAALLEVFLEGPLRVETLAAARPV